MTPEDWQQVKALFHEALELTVDKRRRFLTEACADNIALRAQVETLIASHEEAGEFINEPAFIEGDIEWLEADEPATHIGETVGSYKLVRELGRGGMGAVYLGERADALFDKQVAIKVIKRGMDTDFVIRRFTRERQVLASLDHQNIAKLLDGGVTEDGLPYFVMEYIEGTPVNEYCDVKRLSINKRLRLFRIICAAIQYAHQNLVVHRDIKPSNILITEDGTPKLLDFGIAKLLNADLGAEALDQTATGIMLMTPEYASPEQVRGEKITTASDIYSLGVLLYQLLTGHRPYQVRNYLPAEIMRVVCEQEPERPSTAINRTEVMGDAETVRIGEMKEAAKEHKERIARLSLQTLAATRDTQPDKLRRQLAGDLDNIVLKAMHKELQRRYASVGQFSEDIRRHLEGLPVAARADTFAYRSHKFIWRHRAGVVAATFILVSLVAGAFATAWQAHRANLERARAERRFNDVRKLANSFLFEFHDSIADLQGATPARKLIVTRALEYLDSLVRESSDDASLQRELANAYEKVGNVQGQPGKPNLGDTAGAFESCRKALIIREKLHAADPANKEIAGELAVSYTDLGNLMNLTGDVPAALQYARRAIAIDESLAADAANVVARRRLANGYVHVSGLLADGYGDTAEALECIHKAARILDELVAADPSDAKARRHAAFNYAQMSCLLLAAGNPAAAQEAARKEIESIEPVINADAANSPARTVLVNACVDMCDALDAGGDIKGALDYARKALTVSSQLVKADPNDSLSQTMLAVSHTLVARMLVKSGDTANAMEHSRQALAIVEPASVANPSNWLHQYVLARANLEYGNAYSTLASNARMSIAERQENWRKARRWYQWSSDNYDALRRSKNLQIQDNAKADEAARALTRCDKELTKLQGASFASRR